MPPSTPGDAGTSAAVRPTGTGSDFQQKAPSTSVQPQPQPRSTASSAAAAAASIANEDGHGAAQDASGHAQMRSVTCASASVSVLCVTKAESSRQASHLRQTQRQEGQEQEEGLVRRRAPTVCSPRPAAAGLGGKGGL